MTNDVRYSSLEFPQRSKFLALVCLNFNLLFDVFILDDEKHLELIDVLAEMENKEKFNKSLIRFN